MERYAIKLLFQFKIEADIPCKIRTCEEKIVIMKCNANDVITNGINRGKEDEFHYLNDDNKTVYFEFIGILDICHLGIETEEDEVWYDIKRLLMPMERKTKILPSLEQLKKRIIFD